MNGTNLSSGPLPPAVLACPLWNIHPVFSVCAPGSGADWLVLHSVSGKHFWIKLLHSHTWLYHKHQGLGVSYINLKPITSFISQTQISKITKLLSSSGPGPGPGPITNSELKQAEKLKSREIKRR